MFNFKIPTLSWGNCVVEGIATLRCLPTLLQNIVNILIAGAGLVALFFFVWGSIKLMTSQGDPQKLDAGRKTIIYSVIGLVFVLLSFFIIGFIGRLTGVEQLPG